MITIFQERFFSKASHLIYIFLILLRVKLVVNTVTVVIKQVFRLLVQMLFQFEFVERKKVQDNVEQRSLNTCLASFTA